ncbi:MAG: pyroglutamyl-peptidase I [Sarcina sp.]
MKILITGFDPFGGEKINPALEAIKILPEQILGSEIIKLEIPTVFKKSLKVIEDNIIVHNPDVILSIGQASGRFAIMPERVSINIDDARIPDNEGNQPIDEEIYIGAPKAYFSNLPIKAMVQEMKENNIPSSISNTAGTFVCNHVMYGVLHLVNTKYQNIKAGFIHVPCIPMQVLNKPNIPSMSLIDIAKGLELSIEAIIKNQRDLKIIGGEIC